MNIFKRSYRWAVALVGKIQEVLLIMAEEKSPLDSQVLRLDPALIDEALTPPDLFAYPEIAIEAAIGKATRLVLDPLSVLKDMLESVDMEFTERWELIARAGMFQHRMGEFTKRVYHLGTESLSENIPANSVSYRECIERTLAELEDELDQITGLLDGIGRQVPGCGHYYGRKDGLHQAPYEWADEGDGVVLFPHPEQKRAYNRFCDGLRDKTMEQVLEMSRKLDGNDDDVKYLEAVLYELNRRTKEDKDDGSA